MKHLALILPLLALVFGLSVPPTANADLPLEGVKHVDFTLLPTPTPTASIKFKAPLKQFSPLVTSTITSTPTAGISPSVTETPAVNLSGTPPVGATGEEGLESTSTAVPTPLTTEKSATPAASTRDPILYGLVIAVALFILIQSQWPKIKDWMHKKTE